MIAGRQSLCIEPLLAQHCPRSAMQARLPDAICAGHLGLRALVGFQSRLMLRRQLQNIPEVLAQMRNDLAARLVLERARSFLFRKRQTAPQQSNGFLVRIHAARHLGCAQVVRDCLPWPAGALVVGSQLRADRIQLGGVQRLQRASSLKMQQPPPRRAHARIGHLAQLVVAKVVGICAMLAYDAPLPQLVELAHQGVLVAATGPGEQPETELAANRGCQSSQFPGCGRDLRQARFKHRPYLRRQARVAGEGIVRQHLCSALHQPPLLRLQAGAHGLDHEEWVAFRLLVQALGSACVNLHAGDLSGQSSRGGLIQRIQLDFGHLPFHAQGLQPG